jgi:D-cysteine desulfhydrase
VDLALPARLPLAHLPTPLDPLPRASRRLGLDLHVKRDDQTGMELSGNKVRKLEFLMAQARERGADAVLTPGASTSNHARATAAAGVRLGIAPHLLLRGSPPPPDQPADGNLLLDRLLGATIEFITPAQWPERDGLLAAWADRLRAAGRTPYVIPEGGSCALGSLGAALGVGEVFSAARARGVDVGTIVHACGSAGTAAGVALGCAAAGRPDVDVVSVSVSDERPYFDAKIGRLLDEVVALGYASPAVRARARWRVVDGYKGRGYGLTTPEECRDHAAFAREEGFFLDPVYTGKAWRGLVGEASAGRIDRKRAVVFLHTGGTFGLFPARGEFAESRFPSASPFPSASSFPSAP